MATYSSIAKVRPKFHAVFGLISTADDDYIRSIFHQTDLSLLELAHHFGKQSAGWESSGLDLVWLPSGQVEISSFVGAGLDASRCVEFLVSLTPTWVYNNFPDERAWDIEVMIQADCQHRIDHCSMHLVHELPARHEYTPIAAALSLRDMTAELLVVAKSTPLEHWLELAGNEQSTFRFTKAQK